MDLDLDDLSASWVRTLRAEQKSPETIKTYTTGLNVFRKWCAEQGRPETPDFDTVAEWTGSMLDAGKAPATALSRQAGVRRFTAWCERKGIIDADPLVRMQPPKLDVPAVEGISAKEITALLGTCKGKEFHNVRDNAIIRLMIETGVRADECVSMTTADISLDSGLAVIRRGKGGKGRIVPFSPQAGEALDDYLRARRRHRRASTPALWLGESGRGFAYHGLYSGLTRRAESVGIKDFHPHKLRHTAAIRWLSANGSPTGLMAVAGWSSMDMLRRYIKAAESGLAADESRRLNLGNM